MHITCGCVLQIIVKGGFGGVVLAFVHRGQCGAMIGVYLLCSEVEVGENATTENELQNH